MNKKTVSITSLVAGILTAVVAVFYLASSIGIVAAINGDNPAKLNVYYVIILLVALAFVALLGVLSFFIIRKYVAKAEDDKYMNLPALVYFSFVTISSFLYMCFFTFKNAETWVTMIFAIGGLVLVLLDIFASFDKKVKKILILVALGIGAVLSIVDLATCGGGIYVVMYLVLLAMFVTYFLYYLFGMIVNGEIKVEEAEETKEESKEETPEAEETKEEASETEEKEDK